MKRKNLSKIAVTAIAAVAMLTVTVAPETLNGLIGPVEVQASEETTRPAAFDLRHVGGEVTYDKENKKSDITGGDSYVTSVKSQAMYGTCWAFSATAALETSVLYQLGLTNDEYIEKYGEELDLSERTLAYFGHTALTDESGVSSVFGSQSGEGDVFILGDAKNGMFNVGGTVTAASSILSSGSGILYESQYPYRGKSEIIRYYYKNASGYYKVTDEETGSQYVYIDDTGDNEEILAQGYKAYPYYDTSSDDWSVPETDRYNEVVTLDSSNILSSTVLSEDQYITQEVDGTVQTIQTKVYTGFDSDAADEVKDELLEGKAVSVFFHADTSLATQSSVSHYINPENFAHYTYSLQQANHAVTIVGYDDNYSRYNFLDHSDDEEGDGEAHLPEGDGAWIVKNSWGSTSEEFPNYGEWGEDGSGYFYISYYDRSISAFETYTLDISQLTSGQQQYDINEYDCMSATQYFSFDGGDDTAMSNVFCADEDQLLTSVGITCASANSEVNAEIYLLNDNYTSPTDGTLVAELDDSYEHAGYHSIALDPDNYIYLKKGTYYSVVVTQKVTTDDGTKSVGSVAAGISKDYAEYMLPFLQHFGMQQFSYSNAVVNEGESYVYSDGKWIDWTSEEAQAIKYAIPGFTQKVLDYDKVEEDQQSGKLSAEDYAKIQSATSMDDIPEEYLYVIPVYSVDNLPIKTFSEPVSGTVGTLYYYLNSNGVFTVSGSGDIEQATSVGAYGFTPWFNLCCVAKKIIVSPDVTGVIGDDGSVSNAFLLYEGTLQYGYGREAQLYWVKWDGSFATGWNMINGAWYYYYEDGQQATGWVKPNNAWYYLDATGKMVTGWQKLSWNGTYSWYYFDTEGGWMNKDAWIKDGGSWYYLAPSGAMVTGTYTIGGRTSTFSAGGRWLGYK